MAFKKLRNGGLDDYTHRYTSNVQLKDVMKDINTVRIDDLSPDQIEAARARRSKERLMLEDVELPQNHPFATKQKLTPEEMERSLQNLRAGRSRRHRQYDAMQAAQEQAQAQQNGGRGGMRR
ncbi:hypothetical protein HYH03_005647 [Edaphochlamys debaryana]|uniref:Uncharacterized protein n=1 Tax=Edaphochlamys debaryana TaxID=47281 RepID=A0A836C106_9CHLO|nr:hypothetical protein HYH03_005647 [Edaphochlamys debaryana]|eukprot:KAG2496421.1 hypothetical protein HYH03_005647 [Edaphochlamys debaryana]